jgi:hypothetical protein
MSDALVCLALAPVAQSAGRSTPEAVSNGGPLRASLSERPQQHSNSISGDQRSDSAEQNSHVDHPSMPRQIKAFRQTFSTRAGLVGSVSAFPALAGPTLRIRRI